MERTLSNFEIAFAILMSVHVLAISCSSQSEDEESTTATADTSAPIVAAVSPVDGTTEVLVKSTIPITFSKSIELVSVTVSTKESGSSIMHLSVDGFNTCVPAVFF